MIVRRVTKIALSIVMLAATSCAGGGSSGTGLKSLEGVVSTVDGEPVSGATVTVNETGDRTTTDETGAFSVETDSSAPQATLSVDAPQGEGTLVVDNTTADDEPLQVDITVDPSTNEVALSKATVITRIVGACERYFDNNRIIRQSNRVPGGQICTAKVSVSVEGKPLPKARILLQKRACPLNSPWITITESRTRNNLPIGVGQVSFPYASSEEDCVFRVIAPYNQLGINTVSWEIHTFAKQAYDAATLPAK